MKTYLGQLFKSWKIVSTDLKTKRLANLGRVWKSLKAYTEI